MDFPQFGAHDVEALDRAHAFLRAKFMEMIPSANSRHSLELTTLQTLRHAIGQCRASIQLGGYMNFDRFVTLESKFGATDASLARAMERHLSSEQ